MIHPLRPRCAVIPVLSYLLLPLICVTSSTYWRWECHQGRITRTAGTSVLIRAVSSPPLSGTFSSRNRGCGRAAWEYVANPDPWWWDRRNVAGQPPAPDAAHATPTSSSSIRTTSTSTSPACCSSRSAWPIWTRSPGRATGSCTPGSDSAGPRSNGLTWAGERCYWTTEQSSATTYSSSPRAPGWCQKRPRAWTRGPGPRASHTFYTPAGAASLRDALARFDGGRIAVNVIDMPIKCPVAPLEFCFLADWFFRERKIREPGRADLRHPARRRLHQAGRLGRAGRPAGRRRGSGW